MKPRDHWVRGQDLPAILEEYAAGQEARRRPWRRLKELMPLILFAAWIAFWLVVLLVLGGGCNDPCNTRREHPDKPGTRNPELGTDPAGRQRPAPGQKDAGPTASRRETREAEGAAILPANPSVQSAVIVPSSEFRVSRLLDAIRQVESGGRCDPPDGDRGRSIGPYQIQRAYWTDARVPWPYEAVRGEPEARATILAYWHRRAPEALAAGDLQTLARIHNGGPRGGAKRSTMAYWGRVLAALSVVRFTAENAE